MSQGKKSRNRLWRKSGNQRLLFGRECGSHSYLPFGARLNLRGLISGNCGCRSGHCVCSSGLCRCRSGFSSSCMQLIRIHLPKINIKSPSDGRGRMIRINICISSFAYCCICERVCPRSIGWRVGVSFGHVINAPLLVVIQQHFVQDRFAHTIQEIIANRYY